MTIQFPVYTFHFLYSSCGCSSKGLPASEELPVSVSTLSGTTKLIGGGRGGGFILWGFFWGGQREGYVGRTWPKKPKMALISEYLAADSSADALAIINISKLWGGSYMCVCVCTHTRKPIHPIPQGLFIFTLPKYKWRKAKIICNDPNRQIM